MSSQPRRITFILGSAALLTAVFTYAGLALSEPESRPVAEPTVASEEKNEAAEEAAAKERFEKTERDAKAGDPEAMLAMGLHCLSGYRRSVDSTEGMRLIKAAAEKGHAKACFVYGRALTQGEYVTMDQKEAVRWYRRAAEGKDADAELSLFEAYRDGEGVEADHAEAQRWLKSSAEHGHPGSQFIYGHGILEDKGKAGRPEAMKWLRLSAMQACRPAMVQLAVDYVQNPESRDSLAYAIAWFILSGDAKNDGYKEMAYAAFAKASPAERAKAKTFAENLSKEIKPWEGFVESQDEMEQRNKFLGKLQKAHQGDRDAQFAVAGHFAHGEDTEENPAQAFAWYRKAAELGHVKAMLSLALCYQKGFGTAASLEEARRWLGKAADLGDTEAMVELSEAYEKGLGVTEDKAEAKRWLTKAAEAGDAEAQYQFGNWLRREKQNGRAEYWTRKAADQMHRLAQFNMGCFVIDRGNGAKDEAEAMHWFKLAADQGVHQAMKLYGRWLFDGKGVAPDRIQGAAWMFAGRERENEEQRYAFREKAGLSRNEMREMIEAVKEIEKKLPEVK